MVINMPTYDFSGKTALITGGARGQGRSHANKFAEFGADVAVVDVTSNVSESVPYDLATSGDLEETVGIIEEHGQQGLGIAADVRDEDDVIDAVDQTIEQLGKIDILVNNAGISTVADAVDMSEQMWDEMLDTNLKSYWLTSKHVGKHFIERGEGGNIISTSSGSGFIGTPGMSHYTASKHGVHGLTKTLALELAEHDVNVNAICPSVVKTKMIEGTAEAYGDEYFEELGALTGPTNLFEPEDPGVDPVHMSEAILWLASDASRYVTGITMPVDSGATAK
jgi:SDR family mycofactocin-dependent oxidoreductase